MRRWFVLLGITLAAGAMTPRAAGQSSYHPAIPASSQAFTGTLDQHPVVALTFDDLPAAGSLPAGDKRSRIATTLTAELKANHLKGTYGFVNAVKLENDPDAQQALRIWVIAGMNIGNHTWSHPSINSGSVEAF